MKSPFTVFATSVLLWGLASSQAASPPPAPVTSAVAPLLTPNWYSVEIIAFSNTDPLAGSLETWPADPGEPNWNGAIALSPSDPASPTLPYQLLPPTSAQLTDQWNRLKHSHEVEPLEQILWIQPALDRSMAPAVRVGVPPSAVPAVSTAAPTAVVTSARVISTTKTVPTAVPLQATPVYGSVKLSTTGPYLHLDLDLAFTGPLAKTAATAAATAAISAVDMSAPAGSTGAARPVAAPAYQLYRLQQDRRIDAGKLFYFDHPMFGVLVLVTPVHKQ